NVDTQTYIFLTDVIRQSPDGLPPPGWPDSWGANVVDYGMDPNVVDDPAYSGTIINDLQTLPSYSLVTDLANLFDPATVNQANAAIFSISTSTASIGGYSTPPNGRKPRSQPPISAAPKTNTTSSRSLPTTVTAFTRPTARWTPGPAFGRWRSTDSPPPPRIRGRRATIPTERAIPPTKCCWTWIISSTTCWSFSTGATSTRRFPTSLATAPQTIGTGSGTPTA